MTLTATTFLRRFVQHIVPRGSVRIRRLGHAPGGVTRKNRHTAHSMTDATTGHALRRTLG